MRRFGALEAVVMDLLWSRNGSATVRDVVEELRQSRPVAYTTVMTVMDNLHRKALLVREMDGRAWRYRTVQSREQYAADVMVEVLDASRDRTGTLVHFVGAMSDPEVRRLRHVLDGDGDAGGGDDDAGDDSASGP